VETADKHGDTPAHRSQRWQSLGRAALVLALLVITSGCASTIKVGLPPRTDQLDTLRLSESSRADVLLALGQPQGNGAVRFALGPSRSIWFYDYTEVAGKVVGLKILLVFFEHDKYDGHLWFASTQEFRKSQ
jgi:hypothetical protein